MRPSLIFLLNGGAAKPFRGGFLLDVTRSRSSGIYHTGSLAFHKRFVIFTEATRDARGLVELEASIPTADCRAAQTPACRLQSQGVSRNHRMASPPMAEPNYASWNFVAPHRPAPLSRSVKRAGPPLDLDETLEMLGDLHLPGQVRLSNQQLTQTRIPTTVPGHHRTSRSWQTARILLLA